MIRRAALLLGAGLSALLAMTAAPPRDWPEPSPEPTAKRTPWPTARIRWPIAYPPKVHAGATWSPLWKPPVRVQMGRGR